jgi:hypothetical protein
VQTLAVQGGRPQADIRKEEFTKVGNCHPTLKRSGAKCNHCSTEIPVAKATIAALRKHILQECSNVPKDIKERWQQECAGLQASSTSGEEAVLAGVKRKAQQDIRRHLPHSSWGLTAAEQQEVHFHLLRFAVTANLAFIQMDNPHLHAALTKLRPQYKVPSPSTFSQKPSWRAALLWSMGVDKGQDLLNPAYQEAVTGPKLRTISAPAAGIDPSALAAQFLARQQQQQQLLQQQHLGIPPANPIMPAPGLAQQVLQQQMLLAQLQQQQQQSGL